MTRLVIGVALSQWTGWAKPSRMTPRLLNEIANVMRAAATLPKEIHRDR